MVLLTAFFSEISKPWLTTVVTIWHSLVFCPHFQQMFIAARPQKSFQNHSSPSDFDPNSQFSCRMLKKAEVFKRMLPYLAHWVSTTVESTNCLQSAAEKLNGLIWLHEKCFVSSMYKNISSTRFLFIAWKQKHACKREHTEKSSTRMNKALSSHCISNECNEF